MRYIISKRAIAILFGIISLSFYSGDTYAKCLTKEAPSRPPCCKYKCRFLQPPSPHHWYVDVGVGKSYDFAHDNTIAQMEDAAGSYFLKQILQRPLLFFLQALAIFGFYKETICLLLVSVCNIVIRARP